MPESRNLRARSFAAFGWPAMLLAVAGMFSISLENVSFGHEHLDEGHARHHHHVYLGSHEHHHDEHGQEHGQENEAPPERPGQPGTTTVSAAPALFQPVPVSVLAVGPAEPSLLVPAPAPPPAVRFALQPTPPRGPPLSIAGRGPLNQH